MARGRKKKAESDPGAKPDAQGAVTGYEAELWRMADTLRGSMDAADRRVGASVRELPVASQTT